MDNNDKQKKKSSTKKTIFKSLKIFLIVLIALTVIAGGAVIGVVLSILKDAPDIDPTKINASLDLTSTIYDSSGNLIEKIQAPEFRTIVKVNQMPEYLKDAFISIEDERFIKHVGVDPKGIISAVMDNLKAGSTVRGASTITQQLARNVYLTLEKSWDRKIKEAYLALQIEKVLTKDQILEAYLNRVNLGQGAYGVQEASQTYFSKNVEDLTLAESALFAGIVKSPTRYAPYHTIRPENFDPNKHHEVGRVEILGEKYITVYNEEAVKRQKIILKKMLELEKISESEYQSALNENIKENLKPGQKKIEGISSYFTDYVKTQTVNALMERFGYTKEQAQDQLFTGGLKIYATIDVKLQRELESIYNNFTEILVGNPSKIKGPILVDWRLNKAKDVIDDKGNIIFYQQNNLFNEGFELILEKGTYELRDNNLYIKNKKLTPYQKHIDISDYYTIDDRKNLVTHTVGSIIIPEGQFSISDNKEVKISQTYLNDTKDFYRIDDKGNLLISEKYFFRSKDGIVQPQAATVLLDYRTGHIKALVGGRDVKGTSILNRATASQRQPGSAMKPIAAYLPALDNGYTAASPIDDIPFYANGKLWPRNWNRVYKGINTLRYSVEQSVNVSSVKTVEYIGIQTSMSYLEKLGIISKTHPESDSFVTAKENSATNDENLSALGLGGMTKGVTPLELTAAYGAIANDGVYIEPIAFTKIEDKNGNILIDNTPKENVVVSPQIAYIMGDILRTTVSNGIAGRAKLSNMAVAGKTGTTTDQADIWFVGYTPYYVSATWIGNDSPKITLTQSSRAATQLWQHIMTKMHEGLEGKTSFNKPNNIVSVNVCTISGKLPTELCTRDPRGSTVRSEIFAKGTEPTEYCNAHVELTIDSSTGKIANVYCPEENQVTKVFVERMPPYSPAQHNGIVPSDYQYTAPTEVCDEHDLNSVIESPPEEDDALPPFPGWGDEDDQDNEDDYEDEDDYNDEN
ncbi:PBP1A family penicillin-binding protein [Tissierella pigra]|uniref:PBP1A family penicillin-binding protein n=1 Tax=Tissierella pigra TaxID=2607614 RepID=A0A6N7XZ04_9FIRM|nr:PBP1A family penicillin-binding protein [Tissierella pigra]MBU5427059.1 PBP1A family penicillin-binding protein [Tissierella pigra]MSU01784.1 PBP1A family penicillin-binding protein [Tissierella pigra]